MIWEPTMELRQVETGFIVQRVFYEVGIGQGVKMMQIYKIQQRWVCKKNGEELKEEWRDLPTSKEES